MTAMTKGERTRQKIVADAAAVFNTRGYDGTSLAELMAATGLTKGGIYRHFGSKEELAAEAFDFTWAAAIERRVPEIDEKKDGIGWLRALIANFVTRRPAVAGGCPLLNTAIDADDGNPVLRARVTRALDHWMSRIESTVKHAIRRKQIRPDVNPKMVATLVVATLEGALMVSRLEKSDDALRRVQAHLNEYLDSLLP